MRTETTINAEMKIKYRIVYVSNFFNHHQKPLSDELYRLTEGSYLFVETKQMESERKKMGYEINCPEYVRKSYESVEDYHECLRIINDAETVIFGSCPFEMVRSRIQDNKLTFKYTERPLKNGNSILKYLPRKIKWSIENPNNRKLYLLCASAYAYGDYAKFGLYKNKAYNWGYFTEKPGRSYESLCTEKQGDETKIIWAGRLLPWKHPEACIYLANQLKEKNINAVINVVGGGEMFKQLTEEASDKDLSRYISFHNYLMPEETEKMMEKSDIAIMTSDRYEGWGRVINEEMSSACAVVASRLAGSVPLLIKDGRNGYVFESGNWDEMCCKVLRMIDDRELRRQISKEAFLTVNEVWNSKEAAERLVTLIEILNEGQQPEYSDGPCSIAEIIKENQTHESSTD